MPADCTPGDPFLPLCCGGVEGSGGTLLPAFFSADQQAVGGAVYVLILGWLFLGVAIVSDLFMASIEVITSKQTMLSIRDEEGEIRKFRVNFWNDTVANLTLMALGSSAPEILLSVIELLGNNFFAGLLGPSTIVGSAAFNFFMISAICIVSIPAGEVRYIIGTRVYFVTCTFSIFAYVWFYIVVAEWTPNRVTIEEAVITFLLFPLLVSISYALDQDLCFTHIRLPGNKKILYSETGADSALFVRMSPSTTTMSPSSSVRRENSANDRGIRPEVMKRIREELMNPTSGIESLLETDGILPKGTIGRIQRQVKNDTSELEMWSKAPDEALMRLVVHTMNTVEKKSKAYYRVAATREVITKCAPAGAELKRQSSIVQTAPALDDDEDDKPQTYTGPIFEFESETYSVLESTGEIVMTVLCTASAGRTKPAKVHYETRPGTAKADVDYVHTTGWLVFEPNEAEKTINVRIVDDDIVEEDETFYVDLTQPLVCDAGTDEACTEARVGTTGQTEVTVIDDDEPGVIRFQKDEYHAHEGSDNVARITVERRNGSSGKIWCTYTTEECTKGECVKNAVPAKEDVDYKKVSGTLTFEPTCTSAMVEVPIIPLGVYGRPRQVKLLLRDPQGEPNPGVLDPNTDGGSEYNVAELLLLGNARVTARVEGLRDQLEKYWSTNSIGTHSWREQFSTALYVNGSAEEQAEAGAMDWVLHILCLPFKVIFAGTVPPTDMLSGWASFLMSLCMIGALTAVVADIASLLGCQVGITDDVTAITLVALGTSVPDTFASKIAAQQDPYADASIGNITGSNSVNVFLGLGLPWCLGSVYWSNMYDSRKAEWAKRLVTLGKTDTYADLFPNYEIDGGAFVVPAGTLGFNVAVYMALACSGVVLLFVRRKLYGGELGGPSLPAKVTSGLMACHWLAYLGLSIFAVPKP